MWNIFFFKIPQFIVYFFIFFIIFDIFFSISSICTFLKILEIFMFFILCIRDFIKDFWKIMEHFYKKYRHLKSKIFHKFHYLLFVFLFTFLAFLTSLFPISPTRTCQRILNIFVVLSCTDYRFYQRILENSWILIKKNRDIVNTKHFQNSIVYYLLFNFVVFLTSFFLVYLSIVSKKFLNFLYCFIVCIRDFIKKFCKTVIFFFKKKCSFTKIDICEIFFFQISAIYYLFFYFSNIFHIFFSISSICTF